LAALALLSLLLLLLFLKKRKKQVDVPEETAQSPDGTIDDGGEYISEYGLSEGGMQFDRDEDREDLPRDSVEICEDDQWSERDPDES
jgi:hypothetical protein